jgi:nucleotidyltransferase substrate binding protein (TIGR01987 family)
VALLAREEGLDAYSPREALRIALRLGWVGDDELWLDMLDARNRTSHTYNEATAEAIFEHLPAYSAAMRGLHGRLARTVYAMGPAGS